MELVNEYNQYIKAIAAKDKAKTFAEKKNKERASAWRDYYVCEKACKKMAHDLGLDEDEAFIIPETAAPKKRKCEEELVDLTK
jgi:hypothetical protein